MNKTIKIIIFLLILFVFLILPKKIFAFTLCNMNFQDYSNGGSVYNTSANFDNLDYALIDLGSNHSSYNFRYVFFFWKKADTSLLTFSTDVTIYSNRTKYDYYFTSSSSCNVCRVFYNSNYNRVEVNDWKPYVQSVSGRTAMFSVDTRFFSGSPVILYSSLPVYDESTHEIYQQAGELSSGYEYSINVSTGDYTTEPVEAYTNWFNYEDVHNYKVYYSQDLQGEWQNMNYETSYDQSTGNTQFRFFINIVKNGTYYFKFSNLETEEDEYLSLQVRNLVVTPGNSNFSVITGDEVPYPVITYERTGDYFYFNTQTFNYEDFKDLSCYYISSSNFDSNLGYSNWEKMSSFSFYDTTLNSTKYGFRMSKPVNSSNDTYFFVFYNNRLEKYGSPASLQCDFTAMEEYTEKVDVVIKEKSNKWDDLLNFFKQRFGFLTYPFEFIIDLLNRILNIEYEDPVLHIPEIVIPGTNNSVFSGLDFDFNSILQTQAIANIYNVYLVAVDFIISFGVLVLAYKTILEVFGRE